MMLKTHILIASFLCMYMFWASLNRTQHLFLVESTNHLDPTLVTQNSLSFSQRSLIFEWRQSAYLLHHVHIPRRQCNRTGQRMEPSGRPLDISLHIVANPLKSNWHCSPCYKSPLFDQDLDTFPLSCPSSNCERWSQMSYRSPVGKL